MTPPEYISPRELGEFMGKVLAKLDSLEEKLGCFSLDCKESQRIWHPRIEACEHSDIRIKTIAALVGSLSGVAATILIKIFWR